MLTKMAPVEYIVKNVVPGDIVVVRFWSREDAAYKIRKSSMIRSPVKYKSIMINVDLHCHYTADAGMGNSKREKTVSSGLQGVYTSGDGSGREHRLVFVAPNFDVNKLTKACIYISTDSLSLIQINDIGIQVKKEAELEKMAENKLAFVSTWDIRCGIATYTGFLVDAIKNLKDIGKDIGKDIEVVSINEGLNVETIYAKLVHIQHEFGIMPSPPRISKSSKCIITFHTVMTDMTEDGLAVDNLIEMGMGHEVAMAVGGEARDGGVGSGREMGMEFTLGRFENALNVVGYMVHNQESARTLKRWTSRNVWTVDHGSMYIPVIGKEDARKMLGMDRTYGIDINNDKIGFIFGFQSPNKNYKELIDVCKKIGMKLVISGAMHERLNTNLLGEGVIGSGNGNVIFLNKFLTDMEVNLYALASDVLLFNYPKQDHYSVSGALHRTIGAGRPCILSDTRHFADVKEGDDGVLKFIPGDLGSLERKILEGLEKSEDLGQKAREYADRTLWDKVAKEHLEIYDKYVKFEDKKEEKVNDDSNNGVIPNE